MDAANAAPRCGAKTRQGKPCRSPAIRGKRRCRIHGGASTGARTAEGKARIAVANTKHGERSKAATARRAELAKIRRWLARVEKQEAERFAAVMAELVALVPGKPVSDRFAGNVGKVAVKLDPANFSGFEQILGPVDG